MEFGESKNVIRLDSLLTKDLNELKSLIEENELVYGIQTQNIDEFYIPKDPEYFKTIRRLEISKKLKKIDIRTTLSESIIDDLESAGKSDYKESSLPLLIRQHMIDQRSNLVLMKKNLMLRWRRYCITPDIQNSIKNEYFLRLNYITKNYKELSERLFKLNAVEEAYVCKSDIGSSELTNQDIFDYIYWLVCTLYQSRYMIFISKIIRWSPLKFKISPKSNVEIDSDSNKSEMSIRYVRALDRSASISTEFTDKNKNVSIYRADSTDRGVGGGHGTNKSFIDKIKYDTDYGPAQGGGYAVDERNLSLPLHTNITALFSHLLHYLTSIYEIGMDVQYLKTTADEIEMYNHVCRRFKNVFIVQEQMMNFKAYDKIDKSGSEKWDVENFNYAFLKPATWLDIVPYYPKIDILAARTMNRLNSMKVTDELLVYSSFFVKLDNCEEMQDSIRQFALQIQNTPVVHNTAVISNPVGSNIKDLFKMIYSKYSIVKSGFSKDQGSGNINDTDTYSFTETMQNLGLEEAVDTVDDSSSTQGAYLSYLLLRILKIRDLQRTTISILNYFRSIERTITFNSIGFPKKLYKNSKTTDPFVGTKNDNLGYHQHIHSAGDELRITEKEFMTYDEIENHDDFYFHHNGRVHVRDQKGFWIMYDVAVKDFEKLEKELIQIGSWYITVDRDLRMASLFKRKQGHAEKVEDGQISINELGHGEVDRFGVFYDLWCHHTAFLEAKKKLVDLYMEVYNTIYTSDDKERIANSIINLIYQRPRLDLDGKYFIFCYRIETMILIQKFDIYSNILNEDFLRSRAFEEMMIPQTSPYCFVPKLKLSIHTDVPCICTPYFFEFAASWGMFSQMSSIIEFSLQSLKIKQKAYSTTYKIISSELEFMEFLNEQIRSSKALFGKTYNANVQENILSIHILDNPETIIAMAKQYLKLVENRNIQGSKKSRKIKILNEFGRFFDFLTMRFRLINCLVESEYIGNIYVRQGRVIGYHDYFITTPLAPFEKARYVDSVEYTQPPLYVSSIQDDDSNLSKIVPDALDLAVNEIDNVHYGNFSLKSQTDILGILDAKKFERFEVTLKLQIAHKSALIAGILLFDVCKPSGFIPVSSDNDDITPKFSEQRRTGEKLSAFQLALSAQGPTPLALASERVSQYTSSDSHPEAFFPLQTEKVIIRDKMLNKYVKKIGRQSGSEAEVIKAKRDAISFFLQKFTLRIQQAALRAQIIAYYASIIRLLYIIPDVAKEFFIFGEAITFGLNFNLHTSSVSQNAADDKSVKYDKVISDDGKYVLNIWYIPHFTEILFILRELEDEALVNFLTQFLRIVSEFHDILQFLIGFHEIKMDSTMVSNKSLYEMALSMNSDVDMKVSDLLHPCHSSQNQSLPIFMDYDQDCTFQLKKELLDLNEQMNVLNDNQSVDEVVKLLYLRRKFHYSQFEQIIGLYIPMLMLGIKDEKCFHNLKRGITSGLHSLNETSHCTSFIRVMKVPEPVDPTSKEAKELFPWRTYKHTKGLFTDSLGTWKNLSEAIQLCFALVDENTKDLMKFAFKRFNYHLTESVRDIGNFINMSPVRLNEPDKLILSKVFVKREKKESSDTSRLFAEIIKKITENIKDYVPVSKSSSQKRIITVRNSPFAAYKHLLLLLHNWRNVITLLECILDYHLPYHLYSSDMFRKILHHFRYHFLIPLMRSVSAEEGLPYIYLLGPQSADDIIIYPKYISKTITVCRLVNMMVEKIEEKSISKIRGIVKLCIDKVIKNRNYESIDASLIERYKVLKNGLLKPNLLINVTQIFNIPDKIQSSVTEVSTLSSEGTHTDSTEPDEMITLNMTDVNNALQFLATSVLSVCKEQYEMFAMYFENHMKQLQTSLLALTNEGNHLRKLLESQDQAVAVQRQFRLASVVHDHIREVNDLRARIKEINETDKDRQNFSRLEEFQPFRHIIRNLHSVGYEMLAQLQISRHRIQGDLLRRTSDVYVSASTELSRLKKKTTSIETSNDALNDQNATLSVQIAKSQISVIQATQLMLKVKALYNWNFNYIQSMQDIKVSAQYSDLHKYKNILVRQKLDLEQQVKLHQTECQQMKNSLTESSNSLKSLKCIIYNERKEESEKEKAATLRQEQKRKHLEMKNKKIQELLKECQRLHGLYTSMEVQHKQHQTSRKTVVLQSHREVTELNKVLAKEQNDKKAAFSRVDQLLSELYSLESAFAHLKSRKMNKTAGKAKNELSAPKTSISKPGKSILPIEYAPKLEVKKLTYRDIIKRSNIAYTSHHFLPFRRDKINIQRIKSKLRSKMSNSNSSKNQENDILPRLKKLSVKKNF